MSKTLTQEVFKDVPEWVKSVAVDSDGEAWGHEVNKDMLVPLPYIGKGYNTTDWKRSVIDRE